MNIIITGASRGLGKAIAEKFAEDKQGNSLFLAARNKQNLEQMAKEMQARFPRASLHTMACDLSIPAEALAFGQWVIDLVDKIDILINNAGSFVPGSVHEEEEGSLEKMIAANLYSAYHLTRKIIPVMKAQKSGHIFNMCSIASFQAYKNGGAYSISKFALAGMTRNLREEMKEYGVKVTAIYPGAAYTDSWASSGLSPELFMEARDIATMVYSAAHLSEKACVEEIILRPQPGDI